MASARIRQAHIVLAQRRAAEAYQHARAALMGKEMGYAFLMVNVQELQAEARRKALYARTLSELRTEQDAWYQPTLWEA